MAFRCFIRSPLTLPSAVYHIRRADSIPLSSFLPSYIVTRDLESCILAYHLVVLIPDQMFEDA